MFSIVLAVSCLTSSFRHGISCLSAHKGGHLTNLNCFFYYFFLYMIEKKKKHSVIYTSGLYVAQCRRKTSRSILNAPNKV